MCFLFCFVFIINGLPSSPKGVYILHSKIFLQVYWFQGWSACKNNPDFSKPVIAFRYSYICYYISFLHSAWFAHAVANRFDDTQNRELISVQLFLYVIYEVEILPAQNYWHLFEKLNWYKHPEENCLNAQNGFTILG